ncbi:MAG TPA: metal ABC transporter permease [Candidatus Angelobacter sp.]|jgi:zinc/manganese transport system permease protein|nr:metal ABC transporter permease [Candidatus Angelobacter sp.]
MTDPAAAVLATSSTFSWNPVADWQALTAHAFMRDALLAGTIAAVVSAVIGYFVVLRGLVFAADALTHIGFTGASGAVLLGLNPIAGLLALTISSAVGIGALQQRLRGRDVVTGMILVEALGLGVLFLRLSSGYSNQTYALLFGDILALSVQNLVVLAVAGAAALLATAAIFRPLLFASLDEEVAEARGVPVRALAIGFVVVVAIAVVAATQVIGALLAVVLIVAPAATAQRLTHRPLLGIGLAVAIALLVTWTGIALAFWLPYPVSFFITSLGAIAWLAVWVPTSRRLGAPARHAAHAHAAA